MSFYIFRYGLRLLVVDFILILEMKKLTLKKRDLFEVIVLI